MDNRYSNRNTDSPFQFIEEDPLIACVGVNGGTDDYDIFKGFALTVDLIYESSNSPGFTEDVMVYPMVFSARHAIELGLKLSIKKMMEIYSLPRLGERVQIDKSIVEKSLRDHDIEELTKHLLQLSKIDTRITDCANLLPPYLNDYFFDKKGDMFRYTDSLDGNANLESEIISQIGLTHLHKRFKELSTYLDRLYYLTIFIFKEYTLNSYTPMLSRYQLEALAAELPHIERWKDDSFDEIRNNLKTKYKLSSNQLSDAISCVKSNPHLSALIGLESKVCDIPEKELIEYVEYVQWYAKETENDSIMSVSRTSNTEVLANIQTRTKARREKAAGISDDTLKKLHAFSIIGNENLYSEEFESTYNRILQNNLTREYLLRRLEKKNMFLCVRNGMKECGQLTNLKLIDDAIKDIRIL